MQGVSHLGERRTMLHDGVERFLFPFIRPSRYSRRAPPRRRIGEKRKKRRKIFSPRRKSTITVLFFEQHRRGKTSSQAYSKSWCKLSKSRAHTHTHTHTSLGKQPEKVEFVCMHDPHVASTFDLVRKVTSMAGYWILRYLHALYRFFPHFPFHPPLFFYPSCVTFTRRPKPIKSYDVGSVVP